jgi:membrane-bound ClpP family serine protease
MSNGKTIGIILFIGGIILLIIYGLILDFQKLIETLDLVSMALIGLIIIGLIILIVSIVIEQRKDTKETMKKIKKEDLEP